MLGDLDQFRGGTGEYTIYKQIFGPAVMLTDGAKHVAQNGGKGDGDSAWWLIDAILSHQRSRRLILLEGRQFWKLTVKETEAKRSATLTCDDGNGNVVITQRIPYTDFDPAGVSLWFMDGVMLLPQEY